VTMAPSNGTLARVAGKHLNNLTGRAWCARCPITRRNQALGVLLSHFVLGLALLQVLASETLTRTIAGRILALTSVYLSISRSKRLRVAPLRRTTIAFILFGRYVQEGSGRCLGDFNCSAVLFVRHWSPRCSDLTHFSCAADFRSHPTPATRSPDN
jgi:hypothetical protein